MEIIDKSTETSIIFLGKKTKYRKKPDEGKKLRPSSKSLSILDTCAELSTENLLSLEEKSVSNIKLVGFDDLLIPPFFNDTKSDEKFDKTLANYKKIRAELGSNELAKLYLIDFNRLY